MLPVSHEKTRDAAPAPTVREATFVAEARGLDSLPAVGPPEIAIAGRSNVGKSTLLNRLAGRRSLARTSKTPGRTRGIIFYDLELLKPDRMVRLADLPGYGHAQVSKTERDSWKTLIEGYVEGRPTLAVVVLLIDARRGAEEEELQLAEWVRSLSVPFQTVFTKVDKVPRAERGLLGALKVAPGARAGLGRPLLVSGETGEGVAELWAAVLRRVDSIKDPSKGRAD